jgi:dsDNA-specific endonuclease/ATPase MutS2
MQGEESDSDTGGSSSGDEAAAARWMPAVGEAVRVLKMGGAVGTVASAAGRSGGKVSVRMGSLTVELRMSDLAPAGAGVATTAVSRPSSSKAGGGGVGAAAKQLRARGALTSSTNSTNSSSSSKDGGSPAPIAIQTSRNTVDVRGRQADEAANEVQSAVLSAPSGWALFVVHGVGTGRVRAEVLSMLRRSPRVAKLEEAEASNGGCTVVHIK